MEDKVWSKRRVAHYAFWFWEMLWKGFSVCLPTSISQRYKHATHIEADVHSCTDIYGFWDQLGKDGGKRVRQDTGEGQAGPISCSEAQIPSARQADCVPEKPNSLGQRTSPGRCDFVWLPRNFLPGHQAHTTVIQMKLRLHWSVC